MLRITHILAAIGISLISLATYAQATVKPGLKQELVKRMLEEKWHLSKGAFDHDKDEDKDAKWRTTATDGRVSTAGLSVDEAEISVAYKPGDNSKLLISFMSQSSGLTFPIYYSNNGGSTWSQSTFNSASLLSSDFPGQFAAGGGDPVFAWDKNGRVYFGWIYLSVKPALDTAFFSLNWAYSDDDGHTWHTKPNHFIGRGALDASTGETIDFMDGVTDREWFAVDNSSGPHQGNLYCSYVCFPPGTAPGFQAVKTLVPGVDTFGPAVHAFDGDCQFGNVEVDKNGVLHMSLADIANTQIRHVKSTDGGASFLPSVVVAQATVLFPNAPFIVHNRENAAVNMAVDGATGSGDNVHIVWSDFPGSNVVSYYAHSSDTGNTWTVDTLNRYFSTGGSTLMPTVAGEGSNVAVSLTVVDSADTARYYSLNSTDNGSTFSQIRMLSSGTTNYPAIGATDPSSSLFFGDYNRSQRTPCLVYAAWEDGRSHTSKVYFSKMDWCNVGVQEITAVNDDVQLLSLFPNPATDKVTANVSAAKSETIMISVTDITGKLLHTQQNAVTKGTHNISVDVSKLSKGVYTFSIYANGSVIATRPFIVR